MSEINSALRRNLPYEIEKTIKLKYENERDSNAEIMGIKISHFIAQKFFEFFDTKCFKELCLSSEEHMSFLISALANTSLVILATTATQTKCSDKKMKSNDINEYLINYFKHCFESLQISSKHTIKELMEKNESRSI